MKHRLRRSGESLGPRLEPLEDRVLFSATPITYVDPDGTSVKISLAGNGAMTLTGGDLDITGADQGTRLTVSTSGGDKRTTLGSITVSGAIKSITAKTTDFTGSISIQGSVRTLNLGSFLAGTPHTLTIGGTANAEEASLTFLRVVDLSIDSSSPIKSLTVTDWDDTDGNDLIEAPLLGKVKSKEDFAPGGIIITDEEREAELGKFTVENMMSGSWYVDGDADGFTTGSTAATFRLNVRGKLDGLKVDDDFTGGIAAYDVGNVTINGNVSNALILAGADLGTDLVPGGTGDAADLFFSGDFQKLYVRGTVATSTFGAGLDPANGILNDGDDFVTGKSRSPFKSLTIRGVADEISRFAGGKFGSTKIGGTKIDPNGDPRFLLPTIASDETPPVVTAQIRTNTGDPGDNITSDPTIVGRVTDLGFINSFRFGVDDDELSDFFSIRNLLEPDGTFELLRATIEKVNKGPLSLGLHTINFLAKDEIGNTAPIFTVAFVLTVG